MVGKLDVLRVEMQEVWKVRSLHRLIDQHGGDGTWRDTALLNPLRIQNRSGRELAG